MSFCMDIVAVPCGLCKNTVLTLGVFDGMHRGHQKIVSKVIKTAKTMNYFSAVLTFLNHPQNTLSNIAPRFIITPEEKIRFIEECYKPDFIITITFDRTWAEMPPEVFLKEILIAKLRLKVFVIGHDFHFGKNAEGDEDLLSKYAALYHYKIAPVSPVKYKGEVISSTVIRHLIISGDFKKAGRLLGRPYQISGSVVAGRQLARKLGFPTMNMKLANNILLPDFGVYLIREKNYGFGAANLGVKPTVGEQEPALEAHFFVPPQHIEDNLQIEFLEYIRPEIKFSSLEDMKMQVQKDLAVAWELRKKYLHIGGVMLK
ncbi:MAG: bifunctional riboflavin kinase/FAD synthetase [Bacillota bacterium]